MCKTRLGFVSNSSSSSFIVPIKDKKQKFTVEYDVEMLIEMLRRSFGETELRTIIESKDDLVNYLEERCGWEGQSIDTLLKSVWIKDMYDEVMKQLEDGAESVVLCDVDYSDDLLKELIKNAGGI
ncbi:MAG: hypothetical protein RBS24_07245 [Bacilli bacterium]|nr:hypothetical protein [Bacilli bacterium]